MRLSYDAHKNARNVAIRGIAFEAAADLDWSTALIVEDRRQLYPERRFQVLGFIGERLHMLVFTPRPDVIHVISLRKANVREQERHAAARSSRRNA